MTNKKSRSSRSTNSTPLLEWIFGGVGLVLFIGALGVTVLNGMSPDQPTSITVRLEAPQLMDGRYRVEFLTLNTGDMTAAQVELVATLRRDGVVVETSTVSIEFLPPHSSRRAGVFFTTNPEGLDLAVNPVSYQTP